MRKPLTVLGGLAAMGLALTGCGGQTTPQSAIIQQAASQQAVSFYPAHLNLGHANAVYFYKWNGGMQAAILNRTNGRWTVLEAESIPEVAGCIKPQAIGMTNLHTISPANTYVVGRLEKGTAVASLTYTISGYGFPAKILPSGFWVASLGHNFPNGNVAIKLVTQSHKHIAACVF